jgi:hypothetical protein
VPWNTSILVKFAIPSESTGTVISFGIENVYDFLPVSPTIATIPDFKVTDVDVPLDTSTKKEILATDAFRDLGRYPTFRDSDTTFSLNVALSMNTSFVTMLALYEVI